MTSLIDAIRQGENAVKAPAGFPHAPEDWTPDTASGLAAREGLSLGADHWEVIRALQDFYSRHEDTHINTQALHDALDERFHYKGGMKFLYELFPGGPVAQGCRIAGLEAPAGTVDRGFGSVS